MLMHQVLTMPLTDASLSQITAKAFGNICMFHCPLHLLASEWELIFCTLLCVVYVKTFSPNCGSEMEVLRQRL